MDVKFIGLIILAVILTVIIYPGKYPKKKSRLSFFKSAVPSIVILPIATFITFIGMPTFSAWLYILVTIGVFLIIAYIYSVVQYNLNKDKD